MRTDTPLSSREQHAGFIWQQGSFRHTAPPRSWTPPCCLQLGPLGEDQTLHKRELGADGQRSRQAECQQRVLGTPAHLHGRAETMLRLDKHAKPPQRWWISLSFPSPFSSLPFSPSPWAGHSNATGVCSYKTVSCQLLTSHCRFTEILSSGMNNTVQIKLLTTDEHVRSHNTQCKT